MVTIRDGTEVADDDVVRCEVEQCYEETDEAVYISGADEYVTRNYGEYFVSDRDGEVYYDGDGVELDNGNYVSQGEFDEYGFACDSCGGRFNRDDAYEDNGNLYCNACYENLEHDVDYAHGGIEYANSRHIPEKKCTLEYLPSKVVELLEGHYNDTLNVSKYNKHDDLYVEGTVSLMSSNVKSVAEKALNRLGYRGTPGVYIEHTRNISTIQDTKGSSLTFEITLTDKFGNRKKRIEPLNKLIKYVYPKGNEAKEMMPNKTSVDCVRKISNLIDDKYHIWDNQNIKTCQSNGADQYSRGFADLFLNGSIALLGIREGDNVNGRALVRMMYDKQGQEYLFIDRLYLTGNLAGQQQTMLTAIVSQLIDKGYKVVVSDRSEHSASNLNVLYGNVRIDPLTKSLRSPARTAKHNDLTYYSDSGVRTFESNGDSYYRRDKISKSKVYLVTKL